MAAELVAIRLLSGRASADAVQHAGSILAVRADVAAAWIAEGLAEPAPIDPMPATEPAPRRRRGVSQ